MRTPGPQPLDLLPRAGCRVGGGSAADAVDRPAVPRDAVLREPEDGGELGSLRGGGQPQALQRLMRLMGLEAVHPRPWTTAAAPGAKAYPYLLRDRQLTRVDGVWSSDITYVPMKHGFMYLMA